MPGWNVSAFVMAGAAMLPLGCAGDGSPSRASDAGPEATPREAGMHPTRDVFVPIVHHSSDDAATEASTKPPRRAPDTTADSATPADAFIDAMRSVADVTDASIPDAERPPAGYPEGPYGTHVGDTLPFLRWVGYVERDADAGLVSDGPFTPYSSDDLRRSGKRLALVHLADFDCPGCNHAATVLAARAPSAEREGAAVVEVLGSIYIQAAPADRAHLDAWITTYELHVTSVIDAPGHELATLNDFGIRETALVVNLPTMRIEYRSTGNLAPDGPTSLDDAFDYVHDASPD